MNRTKAALFFIIISMQVHAQNESEVDVWWKFVDDTTLLVKKHITTEWIKDDDPQAASAITTTSPDSIPKIANGIIKTVNQYNKLMEVTYYKDSIPYKTNHYSNNRLEATELYSKENYSWIQYWQNGVVKYVEIQVVNSDSLIRSTNEEHDSTEIRRQLCTTNFNPDTCYYWNSSGQFLKTELEFKENERNK